MVLRTRFILWNKPELEVLELIVLLAAFPYSSRALALGLSIIYYIYYIFEFAENSVDVVVAMRILIYCTRI